MGWKTSCCRTKKPGRAISLRSPTRGRTRPTICGGSTTNGYSDRVSTLVCFTEYPRWYCSRVSTAEYPRVRPNRVSTYPQRGYCYMLNPETHRQFHRRKGALETAECHRLISNTV